MVRRKLIRARTRRLLEEFAIVKPPVPVDRIAKKLGAVLKYTAPPEDGLSGFLLRDSSTGSVVLGVNKDHHEHRRRYTIAHEIGHMLLHRAEAIHVDPIDTIYRIQLRDAESAKGTDIEEREANLFAAELLMPAKWILEEVSEMAPLDEDEKAITALAVKFNVSPQAMTFRLAYLGCTPAQ